MPRAVDMPSSYAPDAGSDATASFRHPARRPEILAPAGDMEMMKAAVENGADAVYFGLETFNARLRARNFRIDELPSIMAWLHARGVRGYVTMNTLVFASELGEAAAALVACSDAGVDAVLVQDLGLAALAAAVTPGLPVHASTQMTLTCGEAVAAAATLGLKLARVVAPRENNLRELARMARGCEAEVEVFVHGALCVAYSGQCLTSEALGGRSANRGECAQACRLPYDLVVDGETRDLADVKYLLSPKDLAGWADVGALAGAGIASLKIEGRLKSPRYVAATVAAYRQALDRAPDGAGGGGISPEAREGLEMTFSRGFTGGYLHATDHQAVVEGRFPKKRGMYLGRVTRVNPGDGTVDIILEGPLKPGDGVVFDGGHPESDEAGGRVFSIEDRRPAGRGGGADSVRVAFGLGRVNWSLVAPDHRVWKTSDPALDKALENTYAGDRVRFRRPVDATVRGRSGEPLFLEFRDADGAVGRAVDTEPAEAARDRPLSMETLRAQLGRLGDTPFELAGLEVDFDGAALLVPFSRLNDLRRRAAAALTAVREGRGRDRQTFAGAEPALRDEFLGAGHSDLAAGGPTLAVLCRTLDQIRAVAGHPGVSTVYVDIEDVKKLREAGEEVHSAGCAAFVPASLRIVKPGEAGLVRLLTTCGADAVLVRNLASWEILRTVAPDLPLVADYSLNVANELTAGLLIARGGFRRLTPSYDLNIDQLKDLLTAAPAHWFEVVVHQRIPMFHMEHCVFCRFLSTGTDFTNCGRPCDTHRVEVRDRVGSAHPVKADAGCRNTVYNAVAQSASEYVAGLAAAGVRHWRVELLDETPAQALSVVDGYRAVLEGGGDGAGLWRRLSASSKLGVTRGSLDRDRE